MRDYRNTTAYQLTRSLMASVYETTARLDLAGEGSGPALALRRAAIGAAASLVQGSALASAADYHRCLGAARKALGEFPRQVNLCQLRGQLTPHAARVLLAQQAEASAALGRLIAEEGALAS
jgi:four helix bundle protein